MNLIFVYFVFKPISGLDTVFRDSSNQFIKNFVFTTLKGWYLNNPGWNPG